MAFHYDVERKAFVHAGPETTGKPLARIAVGNSSIGDVLTIQTKSYIPNDGMEEDRAWVKGLFLRMNDSGEAVDAMKTLMTGVEAIARKWGLDVQGMFESMIGQVAAEFQPGELWGERDETTDDQ